MHGYLERDDKEKSSSAKKKNEEKAIAIWEVVGGAGCAHLEKWWSESQWEGLYIPYMMENKTMIDTTNQVIKFYESIKYPIHHY